MKKINILLVAFVGILAMISCNNNDSYADQLDRERNAINAYIVKHGIKVISEDQFNNQGEITNVDKNEYVMFANTGVYMQIVDRGVGENIKKGETATVLCRFDEYNILRDTLQLSNNVLATSGVVDKMSVTNTSGTFTAAFDPSSSVMAKAYNQNAVPTGWLVPMPYIKIGRIKTATDKLARVRLIVPSSQGHQKASDGVYPCFYDITYGRGL